MKRLICFLMVLITIFSLAGCQLGKTEPEKENPQTSDNTTHEVETEEKDKNVSIKELKDFSIKVDGISLTFPMQYAEFKKLIKVNEMSFVSNVKGYFEPDWTQDMSADIGNKHHGYIYLKNTTGENVTSLDEFTVIGLQLKPQEGIELEIEIFDDDTVESLKERFGEPDYETDKVPLLYYSVPNITIDGETFGVEFWLNHYSADILNHVKIGCFNRVYK